MKSYVCINLCLTFLQILIMTFKDAVSVWLIFTNINCEIQMCCIYYLLVIFIAVYYFIILIYQSIVILLLRAPHSLLGFGYSK